MDRRAIEDHDIPGSELMGRAGVAAFAVLRARWPDASRLLVLCGAGNNAGDGYVIARLAREASLDVLVVGLIDPGELAGDAKQAYQDFAAGGGSVVSWSEQFVHDCHVVVDALLGTGLTRDVGGVWSDVVRTINQSSKPVLAVDVPSGLDADTGAVRGAAVRANATITFVGAKVGLVTGQGPQYTGEVFFDSLDVSKIVTSGIPVAAETIRGAEVARLLPRRSRVAHKGNNGRVLIVGGNYGMAGAARLAGEAALRAGAGLVTVATRPEHVAAVVASRPELMCHGIDGPDQLEPLLASSDVVAVGPGLGQDAWARSLFDTAVATALPLIADADALNLLAQSGVRRSGWVLTPHPGEAARLLGDGWDTTAVQDDRLTALDALVDRFQSVTVLKGAGSLVGAPQETPALCDRGNPGMATAGMGDVLTGLVAGIAAQCGDLTAATRVAVFVHAAAADDAALGGERGLIASDLFAHLRPWLNSAI